MPKITIVTPSFQQGQYLDACIQSVLDTDYPELEYMVLDGGSTDGSVEIIRKYADRLAYWRSHPDRGHMDAVQEGFSRSTGEIMGWLNSDDMLSPWSLRVVASAFQALPEVQWITSMYPMLMDREGIVRTARRVEGFNAEAFYRGRNVSFSPWFYSSFIQQESTFWRRSLWEKAGARVDVGLRVAGDFELWSRFFQHAELFTLGVPLGCFRFQPESFTSREFLAYQDVCRKVLAAFSRRAPSLVESFLRRALRELPDRLFPATGLAYPVKHILGTAGSSEWAIRKAWII